MGHALALCFQIFQYNNTFSKVSDEATTKNKWWGGATNSLYLNKIKEFFIKGSRSQKKFINTVHFFT
jgi:hypothetical protein